MEHSLLSQTRTHCSIALNMIWRATQSPSRQQEVNIFSFLLAISQTIVLYNCFRDCVFLLSAFLTRGCDRRTLRGTNVLALRVQLTRATAALQLILCEGGYRSPVQIATPQSHEISTECQKLKQMRTKWIRYNYITCYTKSQKSCVTTQITTVQGTTTETLCSQSLCNYVTQEGH